MTQSFSGGAVCFKETEIFFFFFAESRFPPLLLIPASKK